MVEGKTPGRLRWALAALGILFALSLFVVLFGAVSRRDFIAAARQQAERRAALEAGTLIADVGKFRVLPFVLVELPDVKGALDGQDRGAIDRLDRTLSALCLLYTSPSPRDS